MFDAKNYAIVGMTHGNTYQLGDEVEIKVVKANINCQAAGFKLIQ
jgi:ribonuclease R